MGFGRTVTGLAALSIAAFYLLFAGSLTSNFKWMCIAAILILTFSWITMGAPKQAARPARKAAPSNSSEPEPSVEEQEIDSDIPEPVTEKELDGATLRERKMAKIQSAQSKQEELIAATLVAQADTSEENLVEVTLEMEDVHVADEFVVEVSPESVENADIEMAISQRKIKHDEIRKKIEMRRRGQLADIRASTARMWEEQTAGEDLVKLLQTPGHGHSVLDSPEHPTPGHIYGATFVRIDEGRILKLRTPLDDGFQQVKKKEEPTLPPLLGPDGLPLPALIGSDGAALPLPALPLPDASSALAQLKKEMDD
ncbi:hypothetical protein N9O16_03710 [Candidatus Poseidoniaceae archaeon]|nr:hypothetical protein [Euryarchaeota archaeon]MDA8843952.1 hypothetical protein [Euryarchaeota archaeon]MDA9166577.1 hypothetical protein [Candidatus Poseidoniaceae archaeon]MDB2593310.1 hypothetical protein [Euryarchaeota archaeon]MDC3236593.1 hypothetical protein [Candidatus Poseidoniaceae archaeon]